MDSQEQQNESVENKTTEPTSPDPPIQAVNSLNPTNSADEDAVVPLPTPEEDASLEQEIEAALGDGSLIDLYDLEQANAAAEAAAASKEEKSLPPGVIRGKVVGITGEDIFIDLGGKSQGMLQRNELPEDAKVEKGDTIEVAIVGYDKQDGLILLSKKTAVAPT